MRRKQVKTQPPTSEKPSIPPPPIAATPDLESVIDQNLQRIQQLRLRLDSLQAELEALEQEWLARNPAPEDPS